MRFEGRLKTWNDERGFGFIEPTKGGDEVFVHIKAFSVRTGRPVVNQPLSFEVEVGPQGKKRAKNVEPIRAARPVKTMRRNTPAQWGVASFFAIPAFLVVYVLVASVWGVPGIYAGVYAVASVLCFVAYALDKSSATAGRWRTPESTLLLLGLACGWPGAILAQQFLRHKSNKAAFRSAFWATVAVNIGVFVLWFSPLMSHIHS
jgi:uncharacterized membrane protein YsdA (DUF1294 family)/cold shock CspA family protein